MPYHIEILSIGADLDSEISDAARILNAVQSDFEFALPPERLRSFGYTCVKEQYRTLEIWSLLEKYRAEAKGDRRHIIAVRRHQSKSCYYYTTFHKLVESRE